MSPTMQAGCFSGLFRKKRGSETQELQYGSVQESHKESVPSVGSIKAAEAKRNYITPCNHSYGEVGDWWLDTDDVKPPSYSSTDQPEDNIKLREIVESTLDKLSPALRDLSLKIHGHPELAFEETFAHDVLTSFMESHGFQVTKGYLGLSTAFRAEFTRGKGGRVIGVNSEYDALKGLGHACGHNLIAVSGCGVALAIKAALEGLDVSGSVVLLGTPAEEGGGGKIMLLERGAYKGMDFCVMSHPTSGPPNTANIASTTAAQQINVEFIGRSAHAGEAPWEGTNALDAAFMAYSGISVLRQQMRPDHRVHGTIYGNQDWAPNVIPDNAKMHWIVRAPTSDDLRAFAERVKRCFEAAARATSCELQLTATAPYANLIQNPLLLQEVAMYLSEHYHMLSLGKVSSASTDFGNVSHVLPSLHPAYAIPTPPNGGNHTIGFTEAAASKEAHSAAMIITKALAYTSFRVLRSDALFRLVRRAFDEAPGKLQ
ncbi:hypothetical protein C8J57DRAFT_708854 [Mycena rebaudengoi]|nr:hypothetical protein C8J57DRAFT_708854 [Mycena rebaudengoi]